MSDFSLFSLFTAGLACMVPFAAAYIPAVGTTTNGNAITLPNEGVIVPAGQPYTITWDPSTEGPVALLLLKGPSSNILFNSVIADSTENDGSFTWTPSTSLEPTAGAEGYGIQLIVQTGVNAGQFQYTTQFGISNPDYKKDSASSSASASASASSTVAAAPGYGQSSSVAAPAYGSSTEALKTASATAEPSWYSGSASSTAPYPTSHPANATTVAPTGGYVAPTGGFSHSNSTLVAPTGSVPTTLRTSGSGAAAPTETVPVSTGAASTMTTSIFGLVLAAGVAVLAY